LAISAHHIDLSNQSLTPALSVAYGLHSILLYHSQYHVANESRKLWLKGIASCLCL